MILFVYKNLQAECPGFSHAGLGISTTLTARYLNEHRIPSEVLAVVDGYDLWAKLGTGHDGVSHVILQAPFFDTPFLDRLVRRFDDLRFVVNYHSNVAFLGVDNWSTKVLFEQIALSQRERNFSVGGNCPEFVETVGLATGEEILYLPNLYPFHNVEARPVGDVLRIGSFGAMRTLKNHSSSAWAVRSLQRMYRCDVEFWINAGRCEGKGSEGLAENIRLILADSPVRLVESGWQTHKQFLHTVGRMDLLLQPSFTESFNIVTADGVARGVPSVVSPAIKWAPKGWMVNPDNCTHTTNKANYILQNKQQESKQGQDALQHHNLSHKAYPSNLCL